MSHTHRSDRALASALRLCASRGAQMTPVRKSALELLWSAGEPLGAYDLLPRLEAATGKKLTPSTVYRTLDFLVKQGFVSKIESRNAFVPCAHPDKPHACVFFVCDRCSGSTEIDSHPLEEAVAEEAERIGFLVAHSVIELRGLCARCRTHSA